MSWLNAEARANIPYILITFPVFQLPMSWLNAEAPRNIVYIKVTCAVFHPPMSWLNAEQPRNICPISVTCPVSHFEMSPLKVGTDNESLDPSSAQIPSTHIFHQTRIPIRHRPVVITRCPCRALAGTFGPFFR